MTAKRKERETVSYALRKSKKARAAVEGRGVEVLRRRREGMSWRRDVVANEATRQEGSLFGADGRGKHRPQASCQDFGEKAVVSVEECDGAVIGRDGCITGLVEGHQEPDEEAIRNLASAANSCEEGSQDGGKEIAMPTPTCRGEAIRSRCRPAGATA
jgi:hypothetical protein